MRSLLTLITLSVMLTACGGGSSDDATPPVQKAPANQAPTIVGIAEQTVNEKSSISITATANDSDGTISSYLWEQASGQTVSLTNTDTSTVSITAPLVDQNETVTLKLTVSDNDGSTATISVNTTIFDIERYTLNDQAATDGNMNILNSPYMLKVDVDNDGLEDIIAGGAIEDYTYYTLHVNHNLGNGLYEMVPLADFVTGFPKVISIGAPGKADFNNDGFIDVYIPLGGPDVWPYSGEQNILLLGSDSGLVLAPEGSLPTKLDLTHDYVFGDIDNDGDIDILEINTPRGSVPTVLINNGDAQFTSHPELLPSYITQEAWDGPISTSPYMTADLADFNNDGKLDVVFAGWGSAPYGAVILLNNNGSFANSEHFIVRELNTNENTSRVRAKDINNDGYPDVFTSNNPPHQNGVQVGYTEIYINNQDMTFTNETTTRLPFQSTDPIKGIWHQNDLYFVDYDEDGDEDIWFHGTGPFRTHIWLNNGTGHYTEKDLSNIDTLLQQWIDSGDSQYDENGTLQDVFFSAYGDIQYTPIFRGNGYVDYLLLQNWCKGPLPEEGLCNGIMRAILFEDQLGE